MPPYYYILLYNTTFIIYYYKKNTTQKRIKLLLHNQQTEKWGCIPTPLPQGKKKKSKIFFTNKNLLIFNYLPAVFKILLELYIFCSLRYSRLDL